jgi:hypothetical protein
MFDTLCALVPHDPDMPARYRTLTMMQRVLDGTLYDVLQHDFHDEKSPAGEYIPIRRRKPSVRYALPAIVVADSVAMLFGEGRFPAIDCEDVATREALADLAQDARLADVMTEAALRGSVGSAAVRLRILSGRLYLDVLDTATLTPAWRPDEPDVLLKVTQAYKVSGGVLMDECGYTGLERGATYWWRVVWDDHAETCFVPQPVGDASAGKPPVPDPGRSVTHGLGFVPIVWIRNLPGGTAPDGACTFRAAIHTAIEIDYQLSQAGRGLKYSSDPQLVIKEPAIEGEMIKSAGNALVVGERGDAKLLEIGGSAAAAVIEYVRALREFALESVHGNRSSAEKMAAAQSGRAMEMLHQPLINLSDHLRSSYGAGLLALARMIIRARAVYEFTADGRPVPPMPAGARLTLRWPPWFSPTQRDLVDEAATLSTLLTAAVMSQETAVKIVAQSHDIGDVPAELAAIKADQAEADARATAQAAAAAKLSPSTHVPV